MRETLSILSSSGPEIHTYVSARADTYTPSSRPSRTRVDSHAVHFFNQHESRGSPLYTLFRRFPAFFNDASYPQNPTAFGEDLRKARKDNGLAIRDLAQLIDVSPDSITNWEIRNVKPAKRNLAKLKAVLQM